VAKICAPLSVLRAVLCLRVDVTANENPNGNRQSPPQRKPAAMHHVGNSIAITTHLRPKEPRQVPKRPHSSVLIDRPKICQPEERPALTANEMPGSPAPLDNSWRCGRIDHIVPAGRENKQKTSEENTLSVLPSRHITQKSRLSSSAKPTKSRFLSRILPRSIKGETFAVVRPPGVSGDGDGDRGCAFGVKGSVF
jgi:hypothetical protein